MASWLLFMHMYFSVPPSDNQGKSGGGGKERWSYFFIFLFETKLELMCTIHEHCFSGRHAWTVEGVCVCVMDVGVE